MHCMLSRCRGRAAAEYSAADVYTVVCVHELLVKGERKQERSMQADAYHPIRCVDVVARSGPIQQQIWLGSTGFGIREAVRRFDALTRLCIQLA
jgi:hypothetical protein